MKAQVLLPMSIALTVALFGLTKIRLKDIANEEKRAKFQDVKLRVTRDVLQEYEKEKQDTQGLMEKAKAEQSELEKAIKALQTGQMDTKKGEVESCKGEKAGTMDEVISLEKQLKTFEADTAKEKTDWEAEAAALKQKLNAPSLICNYLKSGSSVHGLCPEKKEDPKVEPPKPEEPKQEAPKPEEKAAEAPKQEEKKAEAPKQEEKKAEAPKQEEPKQEPPKPDAPKPDAPKQEAPKQEAPKPDAPKPDAPKPDAPKPDAPKPDAPKQEAPKQ